MEERRKEEGGGKMMSNTFFLPDKSNTRVEIFLSRVNWEVWILSRIHNSWEKKKQNEKKSKIWEEREREEKNHDVVLKYITRNLNASKEMKITEKQKKNVRMKVILPIVLKVKWIF